MKKGTFGVHLRLGELCDLACPPRTINACGFFFFFCGKTVGSIPCVFWVSGSRYRSCHKGWCFGAQNASCTAGVYEIIDSSIAQLLRYCFLEETNWLHQLNPQTCGPYSNMKWGVTVNKLYVWLDLFWYMPNIYSMQACRLSSCTKLLLWPFYQTNISIPLIRNVLCTGQTLSFKWVPLRGIFNGMTVSPSHILFLLSVNQISVSVLESNLLKTV